MLRLRCARIAQLGVVREVRRTKRRGQATERPAESEVLAQRRHLLGASGTDISWRSGPERLHRISHALGPAGMLPGRECRICPQDVPSDD